MKRKLYLAVAIVIAGVVTSGSYAFTYSQNALSTLNLAPANGDFATVQTASPQPNWEAATPADATETLRPSAVGDETGINLQFPNSTVHWDKVDETTSDSDASYVATSGFTWEEDLYNIVNHTAGSGSINYVKVYIVARATSTPSQTSAYVHMKTNGIEYNSPEITLTTGYAVYSYQWNTNPQTGNTWTWTEVDNLQAGAWLRQATGGGPVGGRYSHVTQVYVEVAYRPSESRGEVPTGNLFTITPWSGYPGDLVVKVYLTNTSDLSKAYQYLNIKVYLAGSLEAGQTPNFQVLSLDNGVATFNLIGGAGTPRVLSVTGGGYSLNSSNPLQWSPGWTFTPELYAQVAAKRAS